MRVAIFDLQVEKGGPLAAGIGGVFCPVDVASDDGAAAGFAKARRAHGQERILTNCAATANAMKTASRAKADGSIRRFPPDALDRVIPVNLAGIFRCIAHAAASMLTLAPLSGGERGAIVNTASVAAEDGQAGQAAYADHPTRRSRPIQYGSRS